MLSRKRHQTIEDVVEKTLEEHPTEAEFICDCGFQSLIILQVFFISTHDLTADGARNLTNAILLS